MLSGREVLTDVRPQRGDVGPLVLTHQRLILLLSSFWD